MDNGGISRELYRLAVLIVEEATKQKFYGLLRELPGCVLLLYYEKHEDKLSSFEGHHIAGKNVS